MKSAKKINGERTAAGIYHLLKGKRSIQTVQDAHMYGVTNFFGIYKNLSRMTFNKKVEELNDKGYIIKFTDQNNHIFISRTPLGEKILQDQYINKILAYFHGLLYHEKAEIFYHRLLLLIQTLSHTKQNAFSFIPVIDDTYIERWVKSMYKKMKGKEEKFLLKLEEELTQLLDTVPADEANIFVDRLSGYNHYGKSIRQLEESYNRGPHDIYLLLAGLSHQFLFCIENEPAKYPVLNMIVSDLEEGVKLLESTKYTYKLFLENHSPEMIAQIRQLKINTIYDHFTEIALYDPHFPFTHFVSVEEQQNIMEAIQKVGSYKLKLIKDHAHSSISYFQIRLMLILQQKNAPGGLIDVK